MWNRAALAISLCLFSSSALANKCNQKFLNTLTANIFKLGCDEKGDQALCERANSYDGRINKSNRKIDPEITTFDLNPREIRAALEILKSAVARVNPYTIGLRAFFSNMGEYSQCNGDRVYTDSVVNVEFETSKWGKNEFIQMQKGPHTCKADFNLKDDSAIKKFFALRKDEDRLEALKNPAVCDYYSILNDKVVKPLVKKSFDQAAQNRTEFATGSATGKSKARK
jgi:hypothetical protein